MSIVGFVRVIACLQPGGPGFGAGRGGLLEPWGRLGAIVAFLAMEILLFLLLLTS